MRAARAQTDKLTFYCPETEHHREQGCALSIDHDLYLPSITWLQLDNKSAFHECLSKLISRRFYRRDYF